MTTTQKGQAYVASRSLQRTRGRSFGPWPSLVGLTVVLGMMAAMLLGVFPVRRVNVVGANLPITEIIQTSDVTGRSVFLIRRDEVINRLRRIPSIAVTRVEASFPDTVTIYAERRQPYIAWRRGSTTYLLDVNGNVIGTTTSPTLPLIVSTGNAGEPDFATMQALRYSTTIIPHQPDGALAPAQFDPTYGLVVVGQSGWYAVLGSGSAQELGTRVATLAELLLYIAGQGQSLRWADLHLRYGYYCQRGGAPCRSLPPQFGGVLPGATPGVTTTQP
jgi:hypothetical protein